MVLRRTKMGQSLGQLENDILEFNGIAGKKSLKLPKVLK